MMRIGLYKQEHTLESVNFDILNTAGRRKKTKEGFETKKAREILLYRINDDND